MYIKYVLYAYLDGKKYLSIGIHNGLVVSILIEWKIIPFIYRWDIYYYKILLSIVSNKVLW